MKKLFILMFVFVSFSLSAQIGSGAATSFNYGTKYPNATKSDTLSAQTRIPILKASDGNLLNIYTTIDSLSNYIPVKAHASTHLFGGTDQVSGEDLSVNVVPPTENYTPLTNTLEGHLYGIDLALGDVQSTTAGVLTRIYFTGDETTTSEGTFYLSNAVNKGTVPTVSQIVSNNDNIKSYFAQDILSPASLITTNAEKGSYTAHLDVETEDLGGGNNYQQRFTIEIYIANSDGLPIASGVTGAPVGDLGVQVLSILDSGILNLSYGSVNNITLIGDLSEEVPLTAGNRIRYHISAEKIGTNGGIADQTLYIGSDRNSYYDIPTPILWGNIRGTLSDQTDLQSAIDLKVTKVGTPVNNEIGVWTGDPTLKGDPNLTWSGTQMLLQNTESAVNPAIQIGTNGRDVSTWGQGVTTAFNHTSADFNAFADMSIVNLAANDNVGYGAFDVSTQVRGTFGLNHFFGYQSRLDYGSSTPLITSGIFNSMTSFWSSNVVNTGSTVPNAIGMLYQDVTGGGTVENQYGIYINPLSKGTINNYGIYSDNNNYLKSADIDQLVVDGGYPGITVKQDSYIVFGDNGEVDMGFGGVPLDMYLNLINADNLFIRDDQTTRFTFNRPTGNFTATGSITGNSFVKSGGTSSQFLKADGSTDSNSYLLSSSYTAADVLSKLLTVDGSGSGLDADLLRGVHWGNVNTNISTTGNLITRSTIIRDNAGGVSVISQNAGTDPTDGLIFRPVSDVSSTGQFSLNFNSTAVYSGALTANSFIKSGGTNQQALLADGTVKTVPLVYTALISQTGTDAPTVIVLENNLGGTVVWTRSDVGIYFGTLTGAFTSNKTWCDGTLANSEDTDIHVHRGTANIVQVATLSGGVAADGILSNASIEIRVYP